MGILLLSGFVILVIAGVPIAFALIAPAVAAIGSRSDLSIIVIPQQIVAGMDSFPMLAVPLFILAGFLMDLGGISRRLVALASSLVGHWPGGLGQVVVVSEVLFSGVSGSTSADAAAMSGIMVPTLERRGYPRSRAAAIVCAACAAGILVPPAIVMVIYGVVGGVSVGKLFVACIVPAVVLAGGLMLQISWQARRQQWPRDPRASWAQVRRAALEAAWPLLLIVIILGGIRLGVFTATEAAAIAVGYALILGVLYRGLSWRTLYGSLTRTAIVTGMVMLVVGAARLLSWHLAEQQVPQVMAAWALSMGGGPIGFLLLTILLFLLLGAILEGVPAVIMLTPILLPIARRLGIDPVHYGVVIVATQGLSVFLPPVGVSLLVACSVGRVPVAEVTRPLAEYLLLLLGLTLLIALIPPLSMWLPRAVGY